MAAGMPFRYQVEEYQRVRDLQKRLLWSSIRISNVVETLNGPRDWSPRWKKGLERLFYLKGCVPAFMLVPTPEVREACPMRRVIRMVEDESAFIVKVEERLELLYVSPRTGEVMMTDFMAKLFSDLWNGRGD